MRRTTVAGCIFAVILLLLCLYIFRPKTVEFKILGTSLSSVSKVSTQLPIHITFSLPIDTYTPYKNFTITPRTDGAVSVKDKTITFTPTYQLLGKTNYRITLEGATSQTGKVIETYTTLFTTGDQKTSDFEKHLPYTTAAYSVEKLSDSSLLVVILEPPADKVAAEAIAFLKSKNVDTTKVSIQKALSSQD